jgi:putative ABC transport system permease protein
VFHLQTDALRRAALGRFDDPYVVLGQSWRMSPSSTPGAAVDVQPFDTLATELLRGPGIVGVAAMNQYPWQRPATYGKGLGRSPDSAPSASAVGSARVTAGYRELFEIPLLAGRWFADDRADEMKYGAEATGPQRAVLDERAARSLGFASPAAAVGEILYGSDIPAGIELRAPPLEVIGVIGSVPFALRSDGVGDGFVYRLGPGGATFTVVRLDRNRVDEALAHIETVRKALAPNAPAGVPQFLDQAFEAAYATFTRVSHAVTILAAFATAIAAVGLFGMASFLAERRTREIGLRKTQGATTRSILRLLLTDFSKPVLIANVAIWPLAYIGAREYVNLFVERMPITPLPFLATLAATLVLAWLVIGARVVRAARTSPTVALRHE